MLICRGPSILTGEQILAIAINNPPYWLKNVKTGPMIPVYILDARMDPATAIRQNADRSVCGDCPLRSTECYVNIAQGPTQVFKAWKTGKYHIAHDMSFLHNRGVRLGAYGDPAAVPLNIIADVCNAARMWTGYTHQWRNPDAQPYRKHLMASCESLRAAREARDMGWRTFRIKTQDQPAGKGEAVCPASEERGFQTTCEQCGICSGTEGRGTSNICIDAHGPPNKKNALSHRIALSTI